MVIDFSDVTAVLGGVCILVGLISLGVPGYFILAGLVLVGVGFVTAARASRSQGNS
jgi:hypothetical protein